VRNRVCSAVSASRVAVILLAADVLLPTEDLPFGGILQYF
jgi:hypothetical protein